MNCTSSSLTCSLTSSPALLVATPDTRQSTPSNFDQSGDNEQQLETKSCASDCEAAEGEAHGGQEEQLAMISKQLQQAHIGTEQCLFVGNVSIRCSKPQVHALLAPLGTLLAFELVARDKQLRFQSGIAIYQEASIASVVKNSKPIVAFKRKLRISELSSRNNSATLLASLAKKLAQPADQTASAAKDRIPNQTSSGIQPFQTIKSSEATTCTKPPKKFSSSSCEIEAFELATQPHTNRNSWIPVLDKSSGTEAQIKLQGSSDSEGRFERTVLQTAAGSDERVMHSASFPKGKNETLVCPLALARLKMFAHQDLPAPSESGAPAHLRPFAASLQHSLSEIASNHNSLNLRFNKPEAPQPLLSKRNFYRCF